MLEKVIERTSGVKRWKPTGFIAGTTFAGIWPMGLGEIGGGVDLVLGYKLLETSKFSQEP